MAIPTTARKGVTVDLFKESYGTQTFVTRRGEKGETLSVQLTQNGQQINPTLVPLTVKLKGVNAQNKYVEIEHSIQNTNNVAIVLNENWNANAGAFKRAYIEVTTDSGTDLITSVDLNWLVLDNATVTDYDEAHYVDELQEIIDQLQEKADQTLQEIIDKLANSNLEIDELNARITKANLDLTSLINSLTSELNTKIDALTGDLQTKIDKMNADIASALEEFKNGDFYTKTETDTLINQANSNLQAHITDYKNPHKVTKDNVGLGSVPNFASATAAEAETGTITNRLMTPFTTNAFYKKTTEKLRQQWRNGLNWIAHRGNNTDYPENSIPAFKTVTRHWGIETDIQVTSDGRWVIMHDDTVDRTTNGTGAVNSMTFEQFRALRFDTGSNLATLSDTEKTPPTLEEYLAICRERNKVPVIEIKSGTYTTQNYTDLQTILSNYGYSDTNCVIISFSYDILQQVRKLYKDMELHLLSGTIDDTIISNTVSLGFPVALSASYSKLTPEIVNRLHGLGVKVSCYTVPDEQFETMKAMNVDYITTNSLSGNLRFQRLELLNGFTHTTDAGRLDNGYIEELEGGQIHLNFNVQDGVNDQNKPIAKLPDWAVPMYRQYCYCLIRTSSGTSIASFDINGRLMPASSTPNTLSVGLNWSSRTTWAAGSTIYKL